MKLLMRMNYRNQRKN